MRWSAARAKRSRKRARPYIGHTLESGNDILVWDVLAEEREYEPVAEIGCGSEKDEVP